MFRWSCVQTFLCDVSGELYYEGKRFCICFDEGIFGERIGRALQKIHEKNGARFYPQATVTQLMVCSIRNDAMESMSHSYAFRKQTM